MSERRPEAGEQVRVMLDGTVIEVQERQSGPVVLVRLRTQDVLVPLDRVEVVR